MANLASRKWCKNLKWMTQTLAYGYSFESTHQELSNEYQHDRVSIVFKDFCILVLWTKVTSALEGLRDGYLQCRWFHFCTKCVGSPVTCTTARLLTSFLGMDAWRTSQMNVHVALIRTLRWSFLCLAWAFDMASMTVCRTRHWQMSGQLVQDFNACMVLPVCPRRELLKGIL